jgi:hypothetical protein
MKTEFESRWYGKGSFNLLLFNELDSWSTNNHISGEGHSKGNESKLSLYARTTWEQFGEGDGFSSLPTAMLDTRPFIPVE